MDFTEDCIVEGIINRFDNSDLDALNYNEVKEDYKKSPGEWSHHWVSFYDSAKRYDKYYVVQPIYYRLNRELILGELLIEYILAVLLSVILGYLIKRFIPEKFLKI
jgi:hypothetical protein